ncbi:hypothetical protein JOC54_004376 [Alkalihalobacillus xiaoxiensis]|uniref:Glycoamylase-like domain-containing protein n=1 Tax=Shouchella xiaoxiensis TaxID=766895 RepID=A0ABS2T3N8_9BACI|nr:glucoamylase family protein [Shouchella xiaoxiensis]MBM7841077.1 hypothetical protein [Shouchella xiaoxiensis]
MNREKIIQEEAYRSFLFFWEEANTDPSSPGFGLIRDKTGDDAVHVASIASVGFGLSAIIIGIERGWISHQEGFVRTKGTLETFLHQVEHFDGFFYHFLDMRTAKRYKEYHDCASIIDTSLFLNGAITSAEYFGGEIKSLFNKLYERINWQTYYNKETNQFYMGYDEETGGFGQWDMYAEQLMQYMLGTASPTHPVPVAIYDGFERQLGTYGDYTFYNSPGGQLFTHQFAHAWFQFKDTVDKDGIDWFDNSVKASLASRQYAIDNQNTFRTWSKDSWGLTASEGPNGYHGHGTPPYHPLVDVKNDGTVAPCAAAGSIVFTPEESKAALEHFYQAHPRLWSKYGFLDAFNVDLEPAWYSERVIGIDKGITLLMIENERSGLIWDLYMKNDYIKKAQDLLGFKKQQEA